MNEPLDMRTGFYLEGWFVEPDLGRLSKYDKVIQLEPKIMAVLLCLAEDQGKVVKREHFFSTVWADVNVTDHVLARAISGIRKVFNDDPQKPSVIQTIPKAGYRLIAPLSKAGSAESESHPLSGTTITAASNTAIQSNSMNLIFFFGGIIATVIVMAMLLVFATRMHGSH